MVVTLVCALVLLLIAAVSYSRNGAIPRANPQQNQAGSPQTVNYNGSMGGTILVGLFGLGYMGAVVFAVLGLVFH